jgi:Ca-activated chloride channel family protein
VLVSVSVTDAHARFVTGLQQVSFQIFEGKMEQKLSYFSTQDELVSLGLVLDLSGSMAGKFSRLQAIGLFLKIANPEDEFGLVEFRDRPELMIGFTRAAEEIQHTTWR